MYFDNLKLYHSPNSPNSRRMRMFLAEKGLALPLIAVDLGKGEQHSDAYRAINPKRARDKEPEPQLDFTFGIRGEKSGGSVVYPAERYVSRLMHAS
jgi:hypothetical protein